MSPETGNEPSLPPSEESYSQVLLLHSWLHPHLRILPPSPCRVDLGVGTVQQRVPLIHTTRAARICLCNSQATGKPWASTKVITHGYTPLWILLVIVVAVAVLIFHNVRRIIYDSPDISVAVHTWQNRPLCAFGLQTKWFPHYYFLLLLLCLLAVFLVIFYNYIAGGFLEFGTSTQDKKVIKTLNFNCLDYNKSFSLISKHSFRFKREPRQ